MKSVIITSTHPRHKYFAGMLSNLVSVEKYFFEDKPISSESLYNKEKVIFEDFVDWNPLSPFIVLSKGEINAKERVCNIRECKPDVIFTFGCSLLDKEVFSIPKYGCINIHTGIVQHFRGVDSAFWAIRDEKPEGIGATIHYIDETIDAGEIIAQKSAHIETDDDVDDLFLKSCIVGFEALKESLRDIENRSVQSFKMEKKGKLYQTKHKTPEIEQEVQAKIGRVLEEYLND